MPEVRYYIVTQVREVKVATNDEVQAAVLASQVFNGEEYATEPGLRVRDQPKVVELNVKETKF